MKYEYMTTIVNLKDSGATSIVVSPPDESGWALLSCNPTNNQVFYTWAKQKPLAQYTCSDSDFQKSLDLIKNAGEESVP